MAENYIISIFRAINKWQNAWVKPERMHSEQCTPNSVQQITDIHSG